MKFASLSLFAALVGSTSATKSLSGDELNAMIREGKFDAKTLLKNAVPYRKVADRKLEDGGFEITGDYSVTFNSCVSLTTEQDWDEVTRDNENLGYFVQNEKVQSVKNYVLFNVCETLGDCSNLQVSESNTFMVELSTWVESMINYFPTQQEQYCEGCQVQADYCADADENGYNLENVDYDTAFFFYNDLKYQLIDCTECESRGCYDEDGDAYEQNGWEYVQEWLYDLSQCAETESQWLNMDLYAGLMCNQYGTGLEIGLFIDDECTMYTNQKSYVSALDQGGDNYQNYYKSTHIINYLFTKNFDCFGGDLVFVNLFQPVYPNGNSGYASNYDPCSYSTYGFYDEEECQAFLEEFPCYPAYNEDEGTFEVDEDSCAEFMEENPCWSMPGQGVADAYQESCAEYLAAYTHEASEMCQNLFAGDDNGAALSLVTCSEYDMEQENAEDAQEQQDQNQEEGEDQFDYSALTYDLTEDQAEDPMAACYLIDTLFVAGNHLNDQVYDSSSSGELYDYSGEDDDTTTSTGSSNYFPTINVPSSVASSVQKSRNLSTGAIIGISIAAVCGLFILMVTVDTVVKAWPSSNPELELDDSADDRDLPLMS